MATLNNYWFVFLSSGGMILHQDSSILSDSDILKFKKNFLRSFCLSENQGVLFCAEISEDFNLENQLYKRLTMREALYVLDPSMLPHAIRAYSLISWDKNHSFCGRCGKTTFKEKLFERKCEHCALSFFPKISPAIITLIYKGNELLMARSPHYAPGIYGLISGFVDAGESIEDTVHREVAEEVGLKIKNLEYFGSQPWPFPDLLMLAFKAEYDSGKIIIDPKEIEHADWYPYDKLPGRPSYSKSIAWSLIDYFINKCKDESLTV